MGPLHDSYWEWFDKIYSSDGKRPSLETRAELLRGLEFVYTDRQLRDFRDSIGNALHKLSQECSPGLVVLVYTLISALSMSKQIPLPEIYGYISRYKIAVERKCPNFKLNFD